jgi:hypothetical protein
MRSGLLALACLLLASVASAQSGPDYLGCPAGTPASYWPGPYFVPDTTCQGWVPRDHPMARRPAALTTAQEIYGRIEFPSSGGRVSSITSLSGWAFDCALGTFPPVIRIVETKPDSSLREVPNDFHYVTNIARPDVHVAFRDTCPAMRNVPASDGSGLGYYDLFGWSLSLRSPVTEPGVHTFTVTFAWPSKNHAGSMAVSVIVQ